MNRTTAIKEKKEAKTQDGAVQSVALEKAISFSLDTANGTPIYRQIIQQIEYAILSGRAKSGDKLPTIRSLAVGLKINPNTIAKAYSELEIRGILVTQVGSGTFISDKRPDSEEDNLNHKIRDVFEKFMQDMRDMGVEKRELAKMLETYKEEENK